MSRPAALSPWSRRRGHYDLRCAAVGFLLAPYPGSRASPRAPADDAGRRGRRAHLRRGRRMTCWGALLTSTLIEPSDRWRPPTEAGAGRSVNDTSPRTGRVGSLLDTLACSRAKATRLGAGLIGDVIPAGCFQDAVDQRPGGLSRYARATRPPADAPHQDGQMVAGCRRCCKAWSPALQ